MIKGISRKNTHVQADIHGNKTDIYGNKETNRTSFDVKFDNFQGMQKMTEKWEEPSFVIIVIICYYWLLISFDF